MTIVFYIVINIICCVFRRL